MDNRDIDIKLLQISEVKPFTHVNRWEMMLFRGGDVDVELSTEFRRNEPKRTVTLRLGAHYNTLRSQIRRRLLDYVIDAEFSVSALDDVVDMADHELLITPELLRMMLSITIGAIRGMIALRTSGSALAPYPLPIYNLDSLIGKIEDKTVDI